MNKPINVDEAVGKIVSSAKCDEGTVAMSFTDGTCIVCEITMWPDGSFDSEWLDPDRAERVIAFPGRARSLGLISESEAKLVAETTWAKHQINRGGC